MAPNGARRIFVPTNPDLADILGRTDLDFDFFFFGGPRILDFQVPRCPEASFELHRKHALACFLTIQNVDLMFIDVEA